MKTLAATRRRDAQYLSRRVYQTDPPAGQPQSATFATKNTIVSMSYAATSLAASAP
jgi:hypothetical protein